jgi:hypothetical protein
MANQMIALQTRNPQLPDPSKMTSQYATMMNLAQQNETSRRQGLQAQQAMDIKAAEEARAIELQGPALSEAGSKATSAMLKTAMEFNNFVRTALSVADTPDQVAELAGRIARQPQFQNEMFQGSLSEAVASMPRDLSQFEAWKERTAISTLEADKRYAQEFQKQTTGAEERIIAMPKYGRGNAVEVPGSRIKAAEGMQYITGADGATYVVPKQTGGSFGTPAPAVGTPPSMGAPGQGGDTFSRMIRQESRGNQFNRSGKPLTSSAGAIGIAQVMPKTAPEAAKLAGLPFDDNRYRNDPEYNFALGKAYYEKQLADFGGDERKAAAAYNAGPGAVRAALKKGGPDGWVNHVPAETRNYLKVVFGTGGEAAPASGKSNATPSGPTKILPGKPAKGDISPEKIKARDAAVQDLYDAVVDAQKKGHLVSEKKSYIANRATELRQGRPYVPGGTAQKTSVDNIEANAAQLLRQIIQEGTSGTLNAVAEQKLFLKGVGGADSTYETRLRTIRNFAKQNGIKLNESGTVKPKAAAPKRATPTTKAPAGVSAAEWNAMTPAERKLWQ